MKPSELDEIRKSVPPLDDNGLPDLFYDSHAKITEKKAGFKKSAAFFVIFAILAFVFFIPLNFSVTGIARVEADHDIIVEALADGELMELAVHEGDKVKQGQKIGLIYDRSNELELAKAKDDLVMTQKELKLLQDKAEFARKKAVKSTRLFRDGAVTGSEKETADFELHETLQQVNIKETALNSLQSKIVYYEKMKEIGAVKAPIEGIILTKISDLLATFFKKGDELCRIGNMSNIVLELPVYENQLRRIQTGQKVDLKFYAYPDRIFKGKVTGIHYSAYEKTEKVWIRENVINVLVQVEDAVPFVVRSGMTAKASVKCRAQSLFSQLRGAFLF